MYNTVSYNTKPVQIRTILQQHRVVLLRQLSRKLADHKALPEAHAKLWLHHGNGLIPGIPFGERMQSYKQAIVHYIQFGQKLWNSAAVRYNRHKLARFVYLAIRSQLVHQQRGLLWAQDKLSTVLDPVEVFQGNLGASFDVFWRDYSALCGSLQVVDFVELLIRWENVAHYNKIDFPRGRHS